MIVYRSAVPGDARDIADLHARSWRETYRGFFPDAFLDGDLPGERLRVWRSRLDRPRDNQVVLVAVADTSLIGFICAYGGHDPRWGSFIDNVHVARDSKRAGIGSALMQQGGAWLASRYPGQGVFLQVLEGNADARRFYERMGGRNAEVATVETYGGALVRSCRYVWERPEKLSRASG
jgi:ribosomal protein S18 acetylase RimI-like enzyme